MPPLRTIVERVAPLAAQPELARPLPADRMALGHGTVAGCRAPGLALRDVGLEELHVVDAQLAGSALSRLAATGLLADRVDLANARLRGCRAGEAVVRGSRLTGTQLDGAVLRDVAFIDCTLELVNLRRADLRGCVFEDCRMRGADLLAARLEDVRFTGCDLAEVEFHHVSLDAVTLAGCTGLDAIRGVQHLAGAEVERLALLELAAPMAAAIGIVVREDT